MSFVCTYRLLAVLSDIVWLFFWSCSWLMIRTMFLFCLFFCSDTFLDAVNFIHEIKDVYAGTTTFEQFKDLMNQYRSFSHDPAASKRIFSKIKKLLRNDRHLQQVKTHLFFLLFNHLRLFFYFVSCLLANFSFAALFSIFLCFFVSFLAFLTIPTFCMIWCHFFDIFDRNS